MKSHVDLLNATVKNYKTNPRSLDEDGNCRYLSPEGARCAIGRILPKAVCVELENRYGDLGVAISHLETPDERGDFSKKTQTRLGKLFDDYQSDFLYHLQSLHDSECCWKSTDKGQKLSSIGIDSFDKLMVNAKELDGESK